jgi:putative MATE family efflux protein
VSLLGQFVAALRGNADVDLTSGDVGRPLFFLSLPIVVTNLLQTAYNLADTFWLGQYSTEALAAISFAFPMVFLLISLGMGISVAGSVLVAQHAGADEEREAEYAASQTVMFALVAAVVFGGIGYFLVGPFLDLLGASDAVLPGATAYMQIISLGLVAMFGFWVFVSLMRGYGDTVTPMLVMFGSVVLNIVLDPFVIFGFESNPLFGAFGLRAAEASLLAATGYTGSGIAGAAYATVFSRSLALVVGLAIMLSGSRGVRIHLSQMPPDREYVRRIVGIGGPASVEMTGRALSVNLLLFVVGLFPTTVVAAFGIGTRVFSVIFLPAIAVARGVETMTGQNIGADKPDRAAEAARTAAVAMFVVLSIAGVVAFFGARGIAGVFTDDPAVIDVTASFLHYVAPTFGFIGVMRAYSGSFRGAGKTLTAAAIAITMLGIIRLPVAWFGAQILDSSDGIWLAFTVSNVVGAVIAYVWYQRGAWRDADVRGSAAVADDVADSAGD